MLLQARRRQRRRRIAGASASLRAGRLCTLLVLLLAVTWLAACSTEPEPEPPPEPEPVEEVAEPQPPPPPEPEPERVPWEEAFPEDFAAEPTVRIAVLAYPDRIEAGQRVALLLGKYQRKRLERELGKLVQVVYVSEAEQAHGRRSVVRYRTDHLKAAVRVAAAMPREQVVEPMSVDEEAQTGVDLIVYVGGDVR